ncbi:MAG TPA: sugar-binding protein, partial [Polyangiaceae bacterium]|nr:sugar-binding protein [Polyangiaceae bacterium]
HLHVRVVDPAVLVNPDPDRLWDGDAIEIYLAGASGENLTGSYNGTNDGGAIQIVLAPPGAGFPTRGRAFFNPSASQHTNAPINASIYAGRRTDEGYELELRYPWSAVADPAVRGARIAFDLAVGARKDSDAGGRQIQCIISDVFVDGQSACGFPAGTAAQPYCDDRTWCQPTLE